MNNYLSIPLCSSPIDWDKLPTIDLSHIQWTNEPDRAPKTYAKAAFLPGENGGLAIRLYCHESDPKALVTVHDGDVYTDSCVEFFCNFAPEKDPRYVNFECNALGTLHCGIGDGRSPRRYVRDLVPAAVMPKVTIHREADYWYAEYLISPAFVAHLYGSDTKLAPGTALSCNFYKSGECCDPVHFLLWQPVNTPTPDYHRPEFFGRAIIEKGDPLSTPKTEASPLTKRINELARKSKTVGLTPEEKAEQAKLRTEYLAIIRANFTGILDNTVIVREDGSREKVSERKKKQGER